MGNGTSSSITIHIDRSNGFYFTDETISGTVELTINEGHIEAEEIFMQLTGEIGYTSTRTVRDNKNHSSTQTDYHHVPFYSHKTIFSQPKPGQKEIHYGPGKYSWPFQISFENHLPPTMNQPQLYPHVRYYLQVVIDKPWYKPNTRERKYVAVYPHVDLLQNPQCLQMTTLGNHNRKDIALRGTINKSGYVPGEYIHIKLDIDNPKRILIKHINFSLLQSYRIGANARQSNILQSTLPHIVNSKVQQINETYAIQIPSNITLPPSYQYQGGLQKAAVVSSEYILRFVVKVEGLFTNFDVDIPITLGTEPKCDESQKQPSNSVVISSTSPTEVSFNDEDDLPPSYESVVHSTNYQKQEKNDEESYF
ncbi:hypothetical protein I4U23_004037 [Adineta vaga]|nr:hypothetical protein I4U23_004037 [Adineta vaga]